MMKSGHTPHRFSAFCRSRKIFGCRLAFSFLHFSVSIFLRILVFFWVCLDLHLKICSFLIVSFRNSCGFGSLSPRFWSVWIFEPVNLVSIRFKIHWKILCFGAKVQKLNWKDEISLLTTWLVEVQQTCGLLGLGVAADAVSSNTLGPSSWSTPHPPRLINWCTLVDYAP